MGGSNQQQEMLLSFGKYIFVMMGEVMDIDYRFSGTSKYFVDRVKHRQEYILICISPVLL